MYRNCVSIAGMGLLATLTLNSAQGVNPDSRATAYVKGKAIRQSLSTPKVDPNTLNTLASGPGMVSASAVSNMMYQSDEAQARLKNGVVLLAGASASVVLPLQSGNMAAAGPTLHKFDFTLGAGNVKFSRFTEQSALVLVSGNERSVLLVRERAMPRLDAVPELKATVPQMTAEQSALRDAIADTDIADLQVDKANQPVHQEIYVDAEGRPLLAWTILVRRPDNVRQQTVARRYWIAATGEQRILAKEDLIQRDDVVGTYWKMSESSLGSTEQGPLAFLNIGSAAGADVWSDNTGTYANAGGIAFLDKLQGKYCDIRNDAAPNGSLAPTTNGKQRVFPASTEFHLAQVSAFRWITQARLFVDDFLPHNPTILTAIPTYVNIDDQCNAYWDPTTGSFGFFRSAKPPKRCVNTAYAEVVFHEYGHAVDDQFGGIIDSAYSEGFGDALSILITRGSIVGHDFHGPMMHLRDGSEVVSWPLPDGTDPHKIGQAYAGFVWELTRELKKEFKGNEDQAFAAARLLILRAAALNPRSIPDAVTWSFYVDHHGGGKYFKALAAAADSRKLPRPGEPAELDDLKKIAALCAE
jgi:hypothetical protein